jgi:hypothetical protein
MSTKSPITSGPNFYLYHETTLGGEEHQDVYLELDDTREFRIERLSGREEVRTSLQLPCALLDQVAIAWIKHRKLQGAVGGPVGMEWGSPDCPYD